jgi:hypothetical protein
MSCIPRSPTILGEPRLLMISDCLYVELNETMPPTNVLLNIFKLSPLSWWFKMLSLVSKEKGHPWLLGIPVRKGTLLSDSMQLPDYQSWLHITATCGITKVCLPQLSLYSFLWWKYNNWLAWTTSIYFSNFWILKVQRQSTGRFIVWWGHISWSANGHIFIASSEIQRGSPS